jgi:hypothetical protein
MAVHKFSGIPSPNFVAMFNSRTSLQDTLDRFDEQVSRLSPDELRQRLKTIGDVQVNIDGRDDDETD